MKGWTPSDDGPVYIVLGDSSRKWIVEDYGDFLQQTTSATIIRTVSKPPERTSLATTVSGDGIYVEPKAENIEKERQRLRKQLGKVEKGLRTLDAKLANENFLAKADPEVVASETQRQAELQAEMTKLQASLADLEA